MHTPYGIKPLAEVQALAQSGDAMAQAELGLDYGNGVGFPKSMAQSLTWLSKSAAAGNPYGEGYLATFYYDGDRGRAPKTSGAPTPWSKRAAAQGVAEFEFVCGYDYMWGHRRRPGSASRPAVVAQGRRRRRCPRPGPAGLGLHRRRHRAEGRAPSPPAF